jgi:hypothetical protein
LFDWRKTMSSLWRVAAVRQRFSTSASVERPYFSGSRVPCPAKGKRARYATGSPAAAEQVAGAAAPDAAAAADCSVVREAQSTTSFRRSRRRRPAAFAAT